MFPSPHYSPNTQISKIARRVMRGSIIRQKAKSNSERSTIVTRIASVGGRRIHLSPLFFFFVSQGDDRKVRGHGFPRIPARHGVIPPVVDPTTAVCQQQQQQQPETADVPHHTIVLALLHSTQHTTKTKHGSLHGGRAFGLPPRLALADASSQHPCISRP